MVDGKPSKIRATCRSGRTWSNPRETYLAEDRRAPGARYSRGTPGPFSCQRRACRAQNNPPDPPRSACRRWPSTVRSTIRSCPSCSWSSFRSLTGKSPSTTGFGSEGALTKGPFNALWPVVDLNNALVSAILTGVCGFTTSAGHIGPHFRVDHDVSMLVPEIWCRMRTAERDPRFLIDNGHLEKIEDFTFDGRTVLASRLGYRITMAVR